MPTITEMMTHDNITIGGIVLENVYIPRADVLALNLASDETLFIAMDATAMISNSGAHSFTFYWDEELTDEVGTGSIRVRFD